jgi:hypothetical protein
VAVQEGDHLLQPAKSAVVMPMPRLMVVAVLVAMVMIMIVRLLTVSLMPVVVRHLDLLALGAKQALWSCWLRACVGMVRQPLPHMVGVVFRLLSEHLVRC